MSVAQWTPLAQKYGKKYGIDPRFILAVMRAESAGNPRAGSPAGAKGLMQLMDGTAKGLGVTNSYDPEQNVAAGAKMLSRLLKSYHGDYKLTLAAYNAGPGAVQQHGGVPPYRETQQYIKRVLGYYNGGAGGQSSGGSAVPATAAPVGGAAPTGGGDLRKSAGFTNLANITSSPTLRSLYTNIADRFATQSPADVASSAPPAAAKPSAVPSSKGGLATFDGKQVAAWMIPALQYARSQGWNGTITSGFRSLADQTRIYNSGVRPAAKPGTSNHEMTAFPGGAIDVTGAAQLSKILSGSKYANMLVWAGSKDPVHFSHPHNGGY